jgi:curved DNA-binding protein CbpA
MELNFYEILGINKNASEEEMKAAFKSLAKKYHPDKHAGNPVYEEHFKKINSAYQVLSDPKKRERYNLKLFYQSQKKFSTPSPSVTRQQAPQKMRPTYNPKPDEFTKQQKIKYGFISLFGIVVFITGAYFFYNYMNTITAKDYLQEGILNESQKQDLFALESYTAAIGYDENLTEAFIRRANLRIKKMNDYQGAIYDYTTVLKQKKDANIYFQRAKCYIKIKNYPEVLKDLNSAIELNNKFDSLYYYRGEVNNHILQNFSKAIEDYKTAIHLNKNFTEAIFGKAISLQSIEKYKESIDDFNTLIIMKPNEGSYYYYRAYSKFGLKETKAACEDWLQAEQRGFLEARKALDSNCK